MLISETFVNDTAGYRFGESEPYEPFTQDLGKLFRSLQKEYGRCTSKVYVDEDGKSKHVGWCFQKRIKYDDVNEYYLQSAWITLHEEPDTVTTKRHYREIA